MRHMTTETIFNYFKIVVERKAESQERVPEERNMKESITIESTVITRNFNTEIIRSI